ncbi:YbbR-like domain-containing protein [Agrilactobacillus fermenti]|uniref:CdaR family protein n=1 Tax=Agrilactobacillus fermenti TaxID=2586909 RepID=UPI001E5D6E26|nr:CdaR family protein [Agrilactobacillus fermenti]MCD2256323.1 hypothetical protein [Agrilactobacillus fermenti]
MNKLFTKTWVYKVLSLLFALGLFTYVNLGKLSTTRSSSDGNKEVLATKKQTVSMPLELQTDSDKYFITGYPEKVSVQLEGPSALVTTTANTQNFKVMADLRRLGIGRHRVELKQQGLNNDITYKIKPKYITINIQAKATQVFPIQVQFNKNSIADGYRVGEPKLSQETVQATGSKADIERVHQVVANVGVSNEHKTNIDQEVLLQALDSSGKTINVVLEPQTVHVNIPVYLPSKKVTLNFNQVGNADKSLKYEFTSDTRQVTVSGTQATLDKIKNLSVPVDVSGISQTTNKDVKIDLKGTGLQDVDPQTIRVSIKVTKSTNEEAAATASSEGATVNQARTSQYPASQGSTGSSTAATSSAQSSSHSESSSSSSQSSVSTETSSS